MNFGLGLRQKFSTLSKMTLSMYLSICSIYLSEEVFSALMIIKSKYTSTLRSIEHVLRFAVLDIQLGFL